MTLSVPSFLAASTSPAIPPRSLAEVAADALTPPLELSAVFAGGGRRRYRSGRLWQVPRHRFVEPFVSSLQPPEMMLGAHPQQASAAECLDSACEREKYISRCTWRGSRRI